MRVIKILTILTVISSLVLLVSPISVQAKTETKQNQIKKFGSINEFKKFVNEKVQLNNLSPMLYKNQDLSARAVAAPTAMSEVANGDDFSRTNLQVAGVDEADLVKTDGGYIYSVSQNDVFITDAREAKNLKLVTKINFKSQPQNIYLDNNKLVVIGYEYQNEESLVKMIMPRSGFTFIKVFDVTDKLKPRELRSLKLEGDYASSRVINGYLYLITNNYNYSIGPEPLPRIYENDKLINSAKNTSRYAVPNIYYFDMPYHGINLTTVAAVNLRNDGQMIKTEIYALPSGEVVYVSEKALYIAYTKYFDQAALMMGISKEVMLPKLSALDRQKITRIEAVEDFILSQEEKLNKVNQIIERHLRTLTSAEQEALNKKINELAKTKLVANLDKLQMTVVHKINLSGQSLNYQGFVEVPGRVLNQFAMDEEFGYLRVATTRDAAANFVYLPGLSDKRSNGVYIVDQKLKLIGRLEGLAPTEQIYAARFMQDRLYLVTFEQVDPLLVIDLSKAQSPRVLGELKIPGFSQYLHPYDKNTLIGIGRETKAIDGRVLTDGLKISLFDVSQVDKPRELDKLVLGAAGSDSSVLYDHKALLFSAEKKLLAIPATLTKQMNGMNWGELEFDGALVLGVNGKNLQLRERISHDELGRDYQNKIKRLLYIGNNLFSISDNVIKVNELDNLTELNKLQLRKQVDYQISN